MVDYFLYVRRQTRITLVSSLSLCLCVYLNGKRLHYVRRIFYRSHANDGTLRSEDSAGKI